MRLRIIAAVADAADPEQTVYMTASSDDPLHVRLGLVRYLSLRTDTYTRREED